MKNPNRVQEARNQLHRVLTRRTLLRRAAVSAGAAGISAWGLEAGGFSADPMAVRAAQDAAPGQITYSSVRDVFTFDPRLVQTTEEMGLMQHVCEPLVRLDAEMGLVPGLAESWEAVDPNTWSFTLRDGVTFHNGESFNADAVKFSIDDYRRTAESYPWYYLWPEELPEVEVVDPRTVLLKSGTTIATMPRNLALLYMLPPEAAAAEDFGNHPIGTGPFSFVEHQQDVRLELAANPDYWGGAPSVEGVVYRPIPDPSARMVAVQTGEVDVAAAIPPDLIPGLQAVPELTVQQVPGVRIAHYPFNFRNVDSPVANVEVRRALGYAIDGQSILANVLAGAGQPLQGPVPTILFAAADLGGYTFDPEQAKSLLAEASYPADAELTLIYSPGEFIKDREVTEAVQAQLAEVGVNVRIEELEGGAYSERRTTADWDIAINGFSTMNGDPGFFLAWATGPTTFGYDNEATKAVVTKALEAVNDEERQKLLEEAQAMYWKDAPYLWGYTQNDTVAIRNRVTGVEPFSTGWIWFANAAIQE
jgi:peptide/nickel transport system substrate-binding protein